MRLWLVAAVLLAPLASGQVVQPTGVPLTLHFHVVNVQDMPINTQEPPADYAADSVWGPAQVTLRCLDSTTGEVGDTGVGTGGTTAQGYSTSYGYSSLRDLDYGSRSADGQPRMRPERGTAADIVVSDTATPVLTWYVTVGGTTGYEDVRTPALPAPVPNVRVQATMRAGDAISVDDAGYDAGPLLMQGASTAVTLAADQVLPGPSGSTEGVRALGQVADRWVYEFTIPLDVTDPRIPRAEGFNVRIDVVFDVEQCDPREKAALLPASVGAFTAVGARPRLDLTVENAFTVRGAHAQWVGDDLVLALDADSVWGVDDLDLDGLRVDVAGPGQASLVQQPTPQYVHHHGHGTPPTTIVWVWEGANKTAPNGHYEVTITVPNRQHTAELVATIGFDREPAQDAPGLGPLALLGLVALAAFLRRW